MEELTPERIRYIEASWKSDVDLKLDRMVRFMDKTERFLDMLMEREAARAKLRAAIIEKSFIALLWGAVTGIGVLIASGAQNELGKLMENIRQMKK